MNYFKFTKFVTEDPVTVYFWVVKHCLSFNSLRKLLSGLYWLFETKIKCEKYEKQADNLIKIKVAGKKYRMVQIKLPR